MNNFTDQFLSLLRPLVMVSDRPLKREMLSSKFNGFFLSSDNVS